MVGKRKQWKTGKLCLFALPALNYAIYKDANVLNINILVKSAHNTQSRNKSPQASHTHC